MKRLVKAISKHISQADDIFKPATPEEAEGRKKEYNNKFIEMIKEKGMLRSDGLYDYEEGDLDIGCGEAGILGILPQNLFGNMGGNFYCDRAKLTSLVGSPKEVEGTFDCSYNNLTSLEGCPTYVGGDFICRNNARQFTEEEVKKLCAVYGDVIVKDRNHSRT